MRSSLALAFLTLSGSACVVQETAEVSRPTVVSPWLPVMHDATWVGGSDTAVAVDVHGLAWFTHRGRVIGVEAIGGTPISIDRIADTLIAWDTDSGQLKYQQGSTSWARALMVDPEHLELGARTLLPLRRHARVHRADGSWLLESRHPASEGLADDTIASILLFPADGGSPDTLLTMRAPSYSVPMGSGYLCCRPQTFASQPVWAPLPDGRIASVDPTTGMLVITTPDGGHDTVGTVPFKTRRVTRRDLKAYYQSMAAITAPDGPQAVFDRWWSAYRRGEAAGMAGTFADSIGPVSQLIVDDVQRIWIRSTDPREWPGGLGRDWVAMSIEGRVLGRATLPAGLVVFDIRGDEVLALEIRLPNSRLVSVAMSLQ